MTLSRPRNLVRVFPFSSSVALSISLEEGVEKLCEIFQKTASFFLAWEFLSRLCFHKMSRVYVGNLDPRVNERDLEDEFRVYGVIRSIWVARRPPGYAFIDFDDHRDAQDAIREMDGKNGWRAELSHNSKGGGGGGRVGGRGRDRQGGSDMKCYECGEPGHFARECRLRIGPGGLGSGRRRSRSPPRYRRSPSYGRSSRDRSPRRRSYSRSPPRGRSYSRSPPRKRSYSRSPPPRGRSYSRSPPYANGNDVDAGER